MSAIIGTFSGLSLSLIALIGQCIVGLLVLIQYINITLGKDILNPTLEDKLNTKIKNANTKKNILRIYKDVVNKIIMFKRKHKFFLANDFMVEDVNIVLERTFQHLLPDDAEFMTYEQYDASNTLFSIITIIVFIPVLIISRIFFGAGALTICLIAMVGILVYINFLRLAFLKATIASQNATLERCFGDFYLCQHHILLTNHKNPLTNGLQIYLHKAKDAYMKQWTEATLRILQFTTEEFVINRYLISYKDVHTLCTLLTIEKQLVAGGECETQLDGLRQEVIQKKKFSIDENADAIVTKTLVIRNIIYFVFVQVIIGGVVWFVLNGNIQF